MILYWVCNVHLCYWLVRPSAVVLPYWSWLMEIHVPYPCSTSHPCWVGYFGSPLVSDRSGWGSRLTDSQKMGHPFYSWLKFSSTGVALWRAFTWDTIILNLCSHSESSNPHISSPYLLVTNLPTMFFPSSWPSHQTANHVRNPYGSTTLDISTFRKNKQPGALFWVLPSGGSPFSTVFQGHLGGGLQCCSSLLLSCNPTGKTNQNFFLP